ncbi:MAG: hypothetical protein U9Q94_01710, partial [Candidatus Bipolaricaulota bacterium]|nr:hypothetical protein [Candidatus Bipolaricaulota bacterium]
RFLATGLLTAEEGYHRLSHYRDLSVLVDHLAMREDEKSLKALQEELPDWLQGAGQLVADNYGEQVVGTAMSRDSYTPVLTQQIA